MKHLLTDYIAPIQKHPLERPVRTITPSCDDIGAMPRNDVIEMFRERINAGRINTKYKPISFMGMRAKLEHLNKQDLYYTYKLCDRASNFGSKFFYELKVK